MIRLDPAAIYTRPEVIKLLTWNERTVRRAARRIGKKPYSKYFDADEIRRMVMGEK